jgi:hypothetical protein
MANKFSPNSDDFDHAFTAQQQANYTGDNMVNYEQLLMNDHCADYAKLEKSDCENYDVLSKPKIKAYFERENVVPINCKLSVGDVQAVENNDYLPVADDGGNGPCTSSSCINSMSRGPPNSQCSEPHLETPIFNMVDSDNYTIIGDEVTCNSLINLSSYIAAEMHSIPAKNRCNMKQDARSDQLPPVEHAGTFAACLDNGTYLILIDDSGTSCQSSNNYFSATDKAGTSSKSAGNDSKDYLDNIDESFNDFYCSCK